MPEFKNREEYEQWKAEKLRKSQEKQRSQDQQSPDERPAKPNKQSPSSRSAELTDIGDLLTRSWELFKARSAVLLPLQLLSIALLIACIAASVGIGALFVLFLPACKNPILVTSVISELPLA